jgi:hypothetical protein
MLNGLIVPEKIRNVIPETIEDQKVWFSELNNQLKFWSKVAAGAENALMECVAITCATWDNIPLPVRGELPLEDFLIISTHRSRSHIKNMIDTYHTYHTKDIALPEYLDIDKVPPAKQIAAKAAVKRGLMGVGHWEALGNPNITATEFRRLLPPIRNSNNRKLALRFYERDGYIYATDEEQHYMAVSLGDPTTPFERLANKFILKSLGL